VLSISIKVNASPTIPVSDAFDRNPSSTPLTNINQGAPSGQPQWTEVGGDKFSIVTNELRSTAGTGNHIAVLESVTGPTQTVGVSIASVDNQGTPKLGIILRYQDPANFYAAFRKPGPASFLRIAKVVGGVETILGQFALPSPQLNTFFRLSASASGTTITLSLNDVPKITVDDLAFSTGSIGLLIDPGTSASAMHRLNDFSATVSGSAP
jgi:hypothetical protein